MEKIGHLKDISKMKLKEFNNQFNDILWAFIEPDDILELCVLETWMDSDVII